MPKTRTMSCECCDRDMEFLYDVAERKITFVLWECECGHKFLERQKRDLALATAAR